jgi:cell division FtsZ-interacting protein ZapD
VYGKYKSHLAADDERYLRGRLHAGVTAALALKLSLERESANIDSSTDAQQQQQQDEQDADLLAPREARIEEVSVSV